MTNVTSETSSSTAPPSLTTGAATTTPEGTTPTTETPTAPAEEKPVEQTAAAEFVPLARENITFPEGFEYEDATVASFLDLMNNQELTPAQRAEGLLNLQADVAKAASEADSKAWDALQEEWQAKSKADPEFGGDKMQATMTSVGKLVTEYGNDALREALDVTGAGNHPEVIRFLGKLSNLLTEGRPAVGTPAAQGGTTVAQRLFPSMN